MSSSGSQSDHEIVKRAKASKSKRQAKQNAALHSSGSRSGSKSGSSQESTAATAAPAPAGGCGCGCGPPNPCCRPNNPCLPEAMCYDPNNRRIYQAPCNIGVIPMRSAAFQAPCIPLPKLTEHCCCNSQPEVCPDEDGVQFQFKPQTNCRTEVTFTIEPKQTPPWLTMLNCGFKPMVNCSAPPCYLSRSGNPGMSYRPGSQSFVNSAFGSQVNYCGMANFPTVDQIRDVFPGCRIVCDSDDSDEDSSEDSSSSEDDTVARHHVKEASEDTQLSRSDEWHA